MAETIFNINKTHVKYVRSLLNQYKKDLVIIHGDGTMFQSNNNETTTFVDDEKGELVTLTNAIYCSNHHKRYNSGFKETEAIARGGYRAIYKQGDAVPETEQDIIDKFYKQANADVLESTTAAPKKESNIFSFDEEVKTQSKKQPKTE